MVPAAHSHTRALPNLALVSPQANARRVSDKSTELSSSAPTIILCAIAFLSFLGIAFAFWLRCVPGGNPDPRLTWNVFYFLFAHHEPVALLLVAGFSLVSAFVFFRSRKRTAATNADVALGRWFCPAAAVIVFAIAAIGTSVVFHDYLLTADEYLADFQAKIFLRGKVQAEVPPEWVNVVGVIRPTYIDYFPATHKWNATYLPVYAAMRAAFQYVDIQSLLNPLLAAVTVIALYGTIRNIWPESKISAFVGVGLLVSSPQFLLMSMTAYAMPAHLALNAIWLWLYSRPDRGGFYLAPLVGVVAIGLHQPAVHALFALPFLVRLVVQRRWRAVLIFGVIYVAGCSVWYGWRAHYQGVSDGGVGSVFAFLNPRMPIIQSMNLLLIIAWASLATPLLASLGCKQSRKEQPIVQDAMLSCALTFAFYFCVRLDQAHGWGYRYFHGVLACFTIVAIAGFQRLSALVGQRRALKFVLVGVTISIFVQLPLRWTQVERFVRPYARAAAVVHAMPEDMVALDPLDAWYSADLIRNDPFLENRPIMVALFNLTPAEIVTLRKNGSARFLTRNEFARLGLSTNRPNDYRRDPFQLGRGDK
jgi:hypothetical protein